MIPEQPEAVGGRIVVLRGGLVFDTQSQVAPGSVVIQGRQVRAVLSPDSTAWPADAEVIDVTGKFVMPGLIDMHVHLTYPDNDTPRRAGRRC
jgi:imidazolonepropionase-like amidohydrolase